MIQERASKKERERERERERESIRDKRRTFIHMH